MALLAQILLVAVLLDCTVLADEHTHRVGTLAGLYLFVLLFFVVFVLASFLTINACSQYEDQEQVVLWMNTVGPYHNRQETYAFYTLPFCRGPEQIHHHHESLGESIQGVELEFSGLDIKYNGGY